MTTSVSPKRANANDPIEVTEVGISIEVIPEELKAYSPIDVTVLGIVTDLMLEQPANV